MRYLLLTGAVVVVTGVLAVAAAEKHEGKVVETAKNKLTMTDMSGKNKHTHEVAGSAKITLDGKTAKLGDLKNGDTVEVTTDKGEATSIAAKRSQTVTRTAKKIPGPSEGTWRASKIIGANVKNMSGEELGKIEDFVVDPSSGQTKYAVLSFGGFLGIGDKWFAIPWHALQTQKDDNDKFHFVLNVSKERLKNAPGFDKNSWPDVGNPRWADEVDKFYPAKEVTLQND